MFSELESIIKAGICSTQKGSYQESNRDKKRIVIEIACKYYDEMIDKPFNLPEIVDFLVKTAVIPGMIEMLFYCLKSDGTIPAITQELIQEKARHIGNNRS